MQVKIKRKKRKEETFFRSNFRLFCYNHKPFIIADESLKKALGMVILILYLVETPHIFVIK